MASTWAQFIEDLDANFIPPSHVDGSMRSSEEELPPMGWPAVAAMDPATRGNAWTLVIVVREPKTHRLRVAFARQWQGTPSQPLDSRERINEIAAHCRRYGTSWAFSDQWMFDGLQTMAHETNFALVERNLRGMARWETYKALALALSPAAGPERLELGPQQIVADDIKRIRRIITRDGVSVDFDRTADGRHSDFASALAMCCKEPPPRVAAEREPTREERQGMAWLNRMQTPRDPLDAHEVDIDADLERRDFDRAWRAMKRFGAVAQAAGRR